MTSTFLFYIFVLSIISYNNVAGFNDCLPRLATSTFRMNQTSYGTFQLVYQNKVIGNYSTSWMQDNANKRLFLNVGRYGEENFMAEYWLFKNETFETAMKDGKYHCTHIPGKGYDDEVEAYGSPKGLSYIGPARLYDNGWDPSKIYQLYIGPAEDLVGVLNVVMVVEYVPKSASNPDGNILYRGAYAIGVPKQFHYNVYQLNNATNETPPDSVFQVPQICIDARNKYFIDG